MMSWRFWAGFVAGVVVTKIYQFVLDSIFEN